MTVMLVLLFLLPLALATGGNIVGYLPGYKPTTTISSTDLVDAGYTHVIVAFTTFNATVPGTLVPEFATYIPASRVKNLKDAGLKVLISLGGALTNTPGATVDFHQISTGSNFTERFVSSIENLVSTYGFDGVDFDIETGFTSDGSPSDVDVLANVIKLLYKRNPKLLISLVPQAANIAPFQTQGKFLGIYSSYSNLVLQVSSEITWSGVQVYNTGGMNGINDALYSNEDPKNVDFSVAMAVDMLEDWPTKTPDGRDTGFPPYKAVLRPDQVMLGYPAPNAQGASDGMPNKPNQVIKQVLKCLMKGHDDHSLCASYYPPNRNYPTFGGVFCWELTYDQNNQYKFAKELKDCIKNGNC
jgi:chitinase